MKVVPRQTQQMALHPALVASVPGLAVAFAVLVAAAMRCTSPVAVHKYIYCMHPLAHEYTGTPNKNGTIFFLN